MTLEELTQELAELKRQLGAGQYGNPTGAYRQPFTQVVNTTGSFLLQGGYKPVQAGLDSRDIYQELQSFGDFNSWFILSNCADGNPDNGFRALYHQLTTTVCLVTAFGVPLSLNASKGGVYLTDSAGLYPVILFSVAAGALPGAASSGVGAFAANGDTQQLWTAKRTPANSAAAGNLGEVCFDDNFLYICTSAGWKRTALAAF